MANSRQGKGRGYKTTAETIDEKAKKYAEHERTVSEDALRRKERGESGYVKSFDRTEVESRIRSAERNYKENEQTKEGRELNKRNMQDIESEANKVRETNSREQYMHEKDQGDPNALQMSYENWKKL